LLLRVVANMRQSILVHAVAAFTVVSLAAQKPLKVMILFDMEGVSGATDFRHTSYSHSNEYAQGRQSLTADVNAAIAGAKSAGATEIVIVDGHGSGNNTGPDVIEEQLVAPAKVMYRDKPFDIYMDSYDPSFDAIVAVGMHAGAGNSRGFLSHTYTFEDVEYKVNGVPFNETMILAMGAGRMKIPVVAASGDDELEKELRRAMPWAQYATVKHAVDRSRAESVPRDEASRRIEASARDGLTRLASARFPEYPPPYRFALTFQDEAQARNAALLPGSELNGASVQVRTNDFEEGYRLSTRLIGLASAVGRVSAMQAVMNAQAQAAPLRVDVTDWLYGRFLNTLPAAPPPTGGAPSGTRRYWGAQ
jgi:D-amino peptidase